MALIRHRPEEGISNQENTNSSLAAKTVVSGREVLPGRAILSKRPALGDVGNKLLNIGNNNVVTKKVTAMGPPQVVQKKTIPIIAPTKPIIKPPQEKTSNTYLNKPVLKRQESLIKPIHQGNESKITALSKSYSSKHLIAIIDPDDNPRHDPQMVTEYLPDIFNHLRELECKYPIEEHYLDGHQSTPRMRAVLINWLVEVHMNFKLYHDTLHLCIAIVDRYLQANKHVGKETLQLVGIASMLVASKYEDIYTPDIDDFAYVCDDTFSNKQILQMERDILIKLDFNLGRPLSLHFLRRYNKVARAQCEHHALSKYILELALLDYDVCHVRPSMQAAAACCLALAVLNGIMDMTRVWTPTLVHYSTYEYSQLKAVIVNLAHLIVKSVTSKYQTIRTKYSKAKYEKISTNSKLDGLLIRKLTLHSIKK